jgi:hypothetical protein
VGTSERAAVSEVGDWATRNPGIYLVLGLAFVTASALMLEVLDTRLLSVLAWYHLTFLAISVAMLGMAAGAVLVFAGGPWWSPERVTRWLPGLGAALAITLTLSHFANLTIPFPVVHDLWASEMVPIGIATLVLTLPFVFSGVVVTLVLTRTRGRIGVLYGADLLGAAAGCLLIIGLLNLTDITSTALVTAGVAAMGGWCFARHRGARGLGMIALALVLFGSAGMNTRSGQPLGVLYPKNRGLWLAQHDLDFSVWNSHSYIVVRKPQTTVPFLWGGGPHPPQTPVQIAWAAIDGDAGTPFTKWDGRIESLDWIPFDVTALPYQIRHGRAGVIGVGGGRDVLSAIWAGSSSVTGVEINTSFVKALNGPYRAFTGIVDHPGVRIVNDEARSYLSRSGDHFDTLQMSLIDTWAATGAGAFTLTENGLYTREGWRVFLHALAPTGVFSVSRWYEPNAFSETNRLLSLGVASLIDLGVDDPARHLVLATSGHIATLMISPSPFTAADGAALQAAADRYGFSLRISPWHEADDESFRRIAHATTIPALLLATANPDLDFSPPSDARPFFFNILKPAAFWHPMSQNVGVVMSGNLLATSTLFVLLAVVIVLIAAIVGWPLVMMGRPAMLPGMFGAGLSYFVCIGVGFMCVQIPLLQRFSVYLGHPTYTFSIVLFTMILAAGIGSVLSDRFDLRRPFTLMRFVPAAIAVLLCLYVIVLPPALRATLSFGLAGRTFVTIAFVAPVAIALGCCFPIGMRLVRGHSEGVTAWMWGVNGAAGVLASIAAVMISMWLGIEMNLLLASALYAALYFPMRRLLPPLPVMRTSSLPGWRR